MMSCYCITCTHNGTETVISLQLCSVAVVVISSMYICMYIHLQMWIIS